MDSDLLTEARALAERGWLPGIAFTDGLLIQANKSGMVVATTADLHLAAHNEIVRRGWTIEIGGDGTIIAHNGWIGAWPVVEPGTTTLSLLRCLLAACETHQHQQKEQCNG